MSFFAILIALLLEQARPLARSNLVQAGYRAWTVTVRSNFDAGRPHHGWLAWAMAVLLPSVIVLGIFWVLMEFIGWPAAMLWNVAVLYVTLGFRQFSHHFTRIRDALDAGDEFAARQALAAYARPGSPQALAHGPAQPPHQETTTMTVPPIPQSSDTESHPPQAMMEASIGMVLAMPMARTLGLRFVHAEPGRVEVEIPVSEAFSFRPGQLQATAVFAVADFAAVAAAGSVLPPGWTNATVDTTLKIVAPAQGECLRARGRVVDAGRLLTVCAADVWAVDAAGQERLCATLLATARNVDTGAPRPPRG